MNGVVKMDEKLSSTDSFRVVNMDFCGGQN